MQSSSHSFRSFFEGPVTVSVGVCAMTLSIVIGLLGAWGSRSDVKAIVRLVKRYTVLVRGIPDLLLMLLLYYSGQTFLNNIGERTGLWGYVEISTFGAGVSTIGFIFGAYMTETFRGAALSIPRGEIEAGYACGFSRWKLFRLIIWPQLLRFALPGIANNFQMIASPPIAEGCGQRADSMR